jgi:hypothetical protein
MRCPIYGSHLSHRSPHLTSSRPKIVLYLISSRIHHITLRILSPCHLFNPILFNHTHVMPSLHFSVSKSLEKKAFTSHGSTVPPYSLALVSLFILRCYVCDGKLRGKLASVMDMILHLLPVQTSIHFVVTGARSSSRRPQLLLSLMLPLTAATAEARSVSKSAR